MTLIGINNKDINTNDIYNMKIFLKRKDQVKYFFYQLNMINIFIIKIKIIFIHI